VYFIIACSSWLQLFITLSVQGEMQCAMHGGQVHIYGLPANGEATLGEIRVIEAPEGLFAMDMNFQAAALLSTGV
jgi:hypothetical protein